MSSKLGFKERREIPMWGGLMRLAGNCLVKVKKAFVVVVVSSSGSGIGGVFVVHAAVVISTHNAVAVGGCGCGCRSRGRSSSGGRSEQPHPVFSGFGAWSHGWAGVEVG